MWSYIQGSVSLAQRKDWKQTQNSPNGTSYFVKLWSYIIQNVSNSVHTWRNPQVYSSLRCISLGRCHYLELGKSTNSTKFKITKSLKQNFICEHLRLVEQWWLFNCLYINSETRLRAGTLLCLFALLVQWLSTPTAVDITKHKHLKTEVSHCSQVDEQKWR